MTEATAAGGDIRAWTPDTRRKASLGVLAGAAVVLLAGILLYAVAPAQAGWFLWVAIAVLAVLLLFELAVLATGIAREEGTGPAWLRGTRATASSTGYHEPPAAGSGAHGDQGQALATIELRCPECQTLFEVEDTGQRPLEIDCPHCGAHGHVDLPPVEETEEEPIAEFPSAYDEPAESESQAEDPWDTGSSLADEPLDWPEEDEQADEASEPAEELPSISLKCPACGTQFDVEDTGERPLKTTCTGCGKSGKLR